MNRLAEILQEHKKQQKAFYQEQARIRAEIDAESEAKWSKIFADKATRQEQEEPNKVVYMTDYQTH